MIHLAEESHRGLPDREPMSWGASRQPLGTNPLDSRPGPSELRMIRAKDFENLLTALRLLTGSVEMLARQVQSLEAGTPGAPDILSAGEVALIYRGSLNRTKLYELSSPSRPGGAVFSRVERRGGGTGFLRVEIERWLRGFPVRDKEKAAGTSGDRPKGKAEIRRLDASSSTVTRGRVPVKVAAGRESNP